MLDNSQAICHTFFMVTKHFITETTRKAIAAHYLTPDEAARVQKSVEAWTPDFLRKSEFSQRAVTTIITNIASARIRGVI